MGKSFYIIRHIIMKTFIVLAASAIALASGLCLEDDEVVAMCTVGTDIGSKLEAAAAACENGPAAGRRRGKGKGKGKGQKKCPTVEEVWEKVQEEMGDELCVFQQIGWLDESYEFDNATAVADIASLPQEVSMALDENDMGECVES